jgi:hypothetical protein
MITSIGTLGSVASFLTATLYQGNPVPNSRFGDFVDRIYPIDLEIKDTTNTDRFASYLDIHLEIDNGELLKTKLYDKRDDFNVLLLQTRK